MSRNKDIQTLVDLAESQAAQRPDDPLYLMLSEEGEVASRCTFADLDRQAKAIAAALQERQFSGRRAVLVYPPGLDFLYAFFGCLYSGVVPVPVYPPRLAKSYAKPDAADADLAAFRGIFANAEPAAVLTTRSIRAKADRSICESDPLRQILWLDTDGLLQDPQDGSSSWCRPGIQSTDLAFLQYTSGSTSSPKGVMVTHANLLHNQEMIQQTLQTSPQSVGVGWLPLYHDMGLIGHALHALYMGCPIYLMAPATFIKRPIRWLQAISRYRATCSGAPNFAYEMCLRTVTESQRAELDLSCWTAALNGAEPVRADTLDRFATTFAGCGFRRDAFVPCYGMAEATLLVTGPRQRTTPRCCPLPAEPLDQDQPLGSTTPTVAAQRVVSCGYSPNGQQVLIVDTQTHEPLPPRRVGEVWVAGPSVAQGYWNRPDDTRHTFQATLAHGGGPFLRTGDLGFLADDELFVTGRIKDMIIIRGRNHYPQDIEQTLTDVHPALNGECGAAFTLDVDGQEGLGIAWQVRREYRNHLDAEPIVAAIRQAVWKKHALAVRAIALLKPHSLPKTSSGKVQRHACKTGFEQGTLNTITIWRESNKVKPTAPADVSAPTPRVTTTHDDGHNRPTHDPASSRATADRMIDWLRDYAKHRINSRLIDERRCIPPYIVLDLGNQGFLGMQVERRHGGMDLSYQDSARVIQQLAAIDLTLASLVGVHHALGTRPIQRFGRTELCESLLPSLAGGRMLGAFALTEPDAGSNPRAIKTTAAAQPAGGWRLNGKKSWIGNGSWAGVINVFARMIDSRGVDRGIGAFAVRQDAPGLTQGPEALTMGMRGMVQNSVILRDVQVSEADLLGSPGHGMQVAMDAVMMGRLGIAAMSVGGMMRCAQLMLRYAQRRNVATGRLLDNPLTLARISELTTSITSVNALTTCISRLLDRGRQVPEEVYAASKTSGPELLWKATDHLMQMLGGRGYIETNLAPQLLRDARLLRIFEGPTEALWMFIGSEVAQQGHRLDRFIRQDLGAGQLADQLHTAAAQIRQHHARGVDTPNGLTTATRRSFLSIGQVATYALLAAATRHELERAQATTQGASNEPLQRASRWATSCMQEAINQALCPQPADDALCDSQTLSHLIDGYASTIGNLEQMVFGEDDQLDPLLRRDPSQAAVESDARPSTQASDPPVVAIPPFQQSTRPDPRALDLTASRVPRASKTPDLHNSMSESQLCGWMAQAMAKQLDLDEEQIDPHCPFAEFGLDSVSAVEFAMMLEDRTGLEIDPTVFWSFPTIASLAAHICERLASPEPTNPDLADKTTNTEALA